MEARVPLRIGVSAGTRAQPDGIAVYGRELAAAYAAGDDVVTVPVFLGPGEARSASPGSLVLPQRAGTSAALSWATGIDARGARGLLGKIDVFHATDYRIPRLRNLPVCATLFDAIPLSHPEWANPRWRAPKNFLLRKSALWADRVLTISHAMVPELVEQFAIPSERISVTPLGVAPRWFDREMPERIADTRKRLDLAPDYFLFVGTLQPRKNVERIVAAYQRLSPQLQAAHQLVIAGKEGWRAHELVAHLRALAPKGRVRWLNYVDEADLRALYQGAAAFVFPSLYEGFGLPVLEAFASGVPVVTSTATSLPEVAGDAALLVDPLDTDAIAAAMSVLVDDSGMSGRLRKSGLARAATYTWERCAGQTAAIFRSLL